MQKVLFSFFRFTGMEIRIIKNARRLTNSIYIQKQRITDEIVQIVIYLTVTLYYSYTIGNQQQLLLNTNVYSIPMLAISEFILFLLRYVFDYALPQSC